MEEIKLKTAQQQELIDITSQVKEIIRKKGIKEGICLVYAAHASAAIVINENYDPNICLDIIDALNKAIPLHNNYRHDKVDNNAAAHIKSAIIGPSETIPISQGKLRLGHWQSIMLAEFDGPRKNRTVIVEAIKK